MATWRVYNPSPYWRTGYITGSASPMSGPLQAVLNGQMLRTQVDKDQDPAAPTGRATLAFALDQLYLSPGPEDYSSPSAMADVNPGVAAPPLGNALVVGANGQQGLKLSDRAVNPRLQMWLNNRALLDNPASNWFAGSATSVLLDGREVLDQSNNWQAHDPDKRAMQVDQLVLTNPAWADTPYQYAQMYNTQYELVAPPNVGPVRVNFTIRSNEFNYNYTDPDNTPHTLQCRLYREFNLYANTQYVMEDMYVRAHDGTDYRLPLTFAPRLLAHLALEPASVLRYDQNPSWFAVRANNWPHNAYGFATDGQVVSFNRMSERHFVWQLNFAQRFRCLHNFMRGTWAADSWTGDYWYQFIYKPLTAQP